MTSISYRNSTPPNTLILTYNDIPIEASHSIASWIYHNDEQE